MTKTKAVMTDEKRNNSTAQIGCAVGRLSLGMTLAEINALKAADTDFIKLIEKMFVRLFIPDGPVNADMPLDTPLKKYIWRVHDHIYEIDRTIGHIEYIEAQLRALLPKAGRLDKSKDDATTIRYHQENFLLRTSKIHDLGLRLIAEVMQLPIKKGQGMEKQVRKGLDPAYGDFNIIWGYMQQLTEHFKPLRNHLAHNGSVGHADLSMLEGYYRFNGKLKTRLDDLRYEWGMTDVQQELIERYTEHIRIFLKNADTALKMLYIYLAKPALDNVYKLRNEADDTF